MVRGLRRVRGRRRRKLRNLPTRVTAHRRAQGGSRNSRVQIATAGPGRVADHLHAGGHEARGSLARAVQVGRRVRALSRARVRDRRRQQAPDRHSLQPHHQRCVEPVLALARPPGQRAQRYGGVDHGDGRRADGDARRRRALHPRRGRPDRRVALQAVGRRRDCLTMRASHVSRSARRCATVSAEPVAWHGTWHHSVLLRRHS
mmetsp:Transcript_33075/g.82547  ORF Transcript_33075/g.82547 Transcript_33075/m.82547 type:complete len:203 (+) Transcript_33075:224-832(+)